MCDKKFIQKGKLLCVILLAFCLTGCIPNAYTEEEARAQEKEGRAVFRQYAEENLPGAKITDISVHTEQNTEGNCLTDYVDGEFFYEGEKYIFVADTVSGEIYTSLAFEEMKEKGIEYVLDTLGISCDKIVENKWYTRYFVPALKDDPDNVFDGEETDLEGVLPVSFDVENDTEEILSDKDYEIIIYLSYVGDEGLKPEGYDITGMPGLLSLEIRHLKDDEDRLRTYSSVEGEVYHDGIYEYMMQEYVDMNRDNVIYSQWREYEKDHVILAYECYRRECQGETVTETVVEAGKDIQMAVGKEQIRVRGSNVYYYLLETDSDVAEDQNRVVKEMTLNTGKVIYTDYQWLWDGDQYTCGISLPERGFVQGEEVYYTGDAAVKLIKKNPD